MGFAVAAVAAVAVTVAVAIAATVDLERPEEHHQSAVTEVGAEDDALAGDDHVGRGRDGRRGHRSTGSRHRVSERPRQARQRAGAVERAPERGHDALAVRHGIAVPLRGDGGGALADDGQQSLVVVAEHADGLLGPGGGCRVSHDPRCVVPE